MATETKKKPAPKKAATEVEAKPLTKAEEQDVKVVERVIETREIAPTEAFAKLNRKQVELVKRTVAKGATDDELRLFLAVCHGARLNPFQKQVHLIPRWDSRLQKEVRSIQVGIDGFRATAEQTGKYAGNDDAVYDGEKEIEYTVGKSTAKKTVTVPSKATVTVHKVVEGQRYPFTATARWEEYYPGVKMGFQWHLKPYLMLGKCAEALALRKGFPSQLSGIYTPEEMAQAGTESNKAKETQSEFTALKAVIAKASAAELKTYKAKLATTKKDYTDEQKAEIAQMIDEALEKLTKK